MRTVPAATIAGLPACVALAGLLACAAASAQPIDARVAAVGDGTALLAFPVRDGVCGDGAGVIRTGRGNRIHFEGGNDWNSPCVPGPGRLVIEVRNGRVVDLTTRVGGRSWTDVRRVGDLSAATDLGEAAPAELARWLLNLARESDGEPGEDAVFALTLVRDVEPWADLLVIARDGRVRADTREDATFWLAHAAGAAVAADLEDLADDGDVDLEVREAAVFALSRFDDEDRAVESLLKVYRETVDPRIKKRALFWLGESDDPRALALFETILLED